MTHADFTIRPMSRIEFNLALDWAAAEGWNPGLMDAEPFFSVDPEGLLIGLLGHEPVAVISAVRYDAAFGFLGFYIVKPAYRGKGYGWRIWQAAMAHLGTRNVGLDGVTAQQDNYRRSGFQLAYRNVRYQGTAATTPLQATLPSNARIIPLNTLALAELSAFDRHFFPAARPDFLRRWISQPQSLALGVVSDQGLQGYGVRRSCRTGYKMGPLFANRPELATALLDALCIDVASDAPIFLDVPESNPAAVVLAEARGMHRVFETARMYTQAAPDLALSHIYGITSFELG
ncbi:hypothetical protein MIZ03_2701 [Rhodoferax lithotrophicus]|uniref:N-acetyltransferase domain-containing protein n=1 Tax=Rhodoferax lithotrophicus TaxID=2798804 RepID=A0ABM7MNH9_9BURK|nr:GNAT family N-acetyltransferase [Rhodoferax sp. MIZ03]BCO27810.1 hypothetical protein MIZ03_2701 [Rhodoferax sp. MIZ03]